MSETAQLVSSIASYISKGLTGNSSLKRVIEERFISSQ